MTSVAVGGMTFVNAWEPDGSGVVRVLSRLDGWDDGVGVNATLRNRPQAHGVFAERGWRDGRMVVIEGAVECPDRGSAAAQKRALSALLADGTFSEFVVSDPDDGVLSATVRLGAAPVVDWARTSRTVFYQFSLYAPDPLRYGEVQTAATTFPVRTGGLRFPLYSDGAGTNVGALDYGEVSQTGRLVLSNEGTADSWPQFVVEGPVGSSGFELITVGTGARVTYSGAVPAGSQLVLDSATGTAVIDGVADRGGRLTHRDWTPVPAGGSVEFAFVPLGATSSAVLHATVRPAFW